MIPATKVLDSETGKEDAREAENCENQARVAGEAVKAEEQADDVIEAQKQVKEPPEETGSMKPEDSKKTFLCNGYCV